VFPGPVHYLGMIFVAKNIGNTLQRISAICEQGYEKHMDVDIMDIWAMILRMCGHGRGHLDNDIKNG